MIYFALTNTHLLCVQWARVDGKSILTKISYKPFRHSLDEIWNKESEFVSVFSAALHQIKEEINPDGQNVILTLPDEWCRSADINLDREMTVMDGWNLALWTLNQRWGIKDNASFGRIFEGNPGSIFALSLLFDFIDPLKLIFAELGMRITWIGTESSIFFGLAPKQGCTVLIPSGSAYKYFTYNLNYFGSGTARFVKDSWKTRNLVGLPLGKDLKAGSLMVTGILSEKRKQHFKNLKPLIIKPLDRINIEGINVPSDVPEFLQCLSTAVITGTSGAALNFLGPRGLQPYNFVSPKEEKASKIDKISDKPNKTKTSAIKKKNSYLAPTYFLIISIFIFLIFLKNYFNSSPENILPKSDIPVIKEEMIDSNKNDLNYTGIVADYFQKSQLIAHQMSLILNSGMQPKITFISSSSEDIRIDLVGDRIMDNDFERVGEVMSYELSEINCCGGFKHGYIIKSNSKQFQYLDNWIMAEQLDSLFRNDSEYVKVKKLSARPLAIYNQHPLKVEVLSHNRIIQTLAGVKQAGDNVALEKFIYYSNPENSEPIAIFYISLLEKLNP